MEKKKNHQLIGSVMAISSGALWALAGLMGQTFFENFHGSPEWITSTRLLFSGIILLIYGYIRQGKALFAIWREKTSVFHLILFAIFGMLGVQFTFYKTIELSNASTGTVLQFIAPIFILLYQVFFLKKKVKPLTIFLVLLTVVGIVLLVTHGDFGHLQISSLAIFTGVISALALAFLPCFQFI
ncbi:MAG: DMT family transporter [Lactobacillales bacterium]|jgi:drug/metabolite transporter (DMT)-like permease|nr:DMT family transporter [Lactobacillales bacterium]